MQAGIGDFVAVGSLAWTLYRDCYRVCKGAPQEFRLVVEELKSIHMTMKVFEEELKDPDNNILARAGEDRQKTFRSMLVQTHKILLDLENIFKKNINLMNTSSSSSSRSRMKRSWDKFKWSIDAKDVDSLRNKLCYHNGVFSLLLISIGNSSLQRLEETTRRIGDGVDEIKSFLYRADTGELPVVSAPSGVDRVSRLRFSEKCLEAAEISHRWFMIGIQEWINVGRWWFLRAEADMSGNAAGASVSQQAYINLNKASWILTDVINVHPHLSHVESRVRFEAMHLVEAINEEFKFIQDKKLALPKLEVDDLQIWEVQAQRPTLRPGSMSQGQGRAWEMQDEEVIFQKFAQYQADHTTPLSSLVLVLVNKKSN